MLARTPEVRRLAEVIGVAGDGAPLWLLARAADLTEAEAAEAADAMVEAGLLARPTRRCPPVPGVAGSGR